MKTFQTILVSAFLLLSFNTISAQYGGGGYGGGSYGGGMNGGGMNGGGMNGGRNGGMSRGMNQDNHQEKPKEIPIEVTVAKIMEKITPVLKLDELQAIAVSNVLTESIRSQGILLKQDTSQDDKIKDIQALSETTDRKINEFLNDDQKAKYIAFKEDSKNQKQSHSGGKHKKEETK